MKLRLVFKSSAKRNKKSRAFDVNLPVLIGRGERANFRIPHVRISRQHCEIFEENGAVYVRDLGSTNGTMLRGTMLPSKAKARVASGNVLTLGGLLFRLEYQAPPAAGAAVAEAIDFLEAEPEELLAEPLMELDPADDSEFAAEAVLPTSETAAVPPAAPAVGDELFLEPEAELLEAAGAFLEEEDALPELESGDNDAAEQGSSSDDDLAAFLNDSEDDS